MTQFPGDRSFELFSSSIFRIEARWGLGASPGAGQQPPAGQVWSSVATGFAVAIFADSRRLVLATARHVLDVPDDEMIGWRVQQFDARGEVVRQVTFGTNKKLKSGVPYDFHKNADIGTLVLPRLGDDKLPFARPDEVPVRVIDILSGASTGTRVGWAGFPGLVADRLGFPQLCYFEGVISAMVNRADRQIYIVDGHGGEGVSGGPVWHWSAEKDRPEVIGIVSGYQGASVDEPWLPGYCVFEPINPLMHRFHHECYHPDKTGEHIITNRYG
ncbi:hypothetical protein AYO44_01095 [Planctomycetaceae bacterium SCGC AG-212-F19]|nr:hypothetical protein AYO44_01095 [Planctomycetaceae bacterium SCGC AG-212-F19]